MTSESAIVYYLQVHPAVFEYCRPESLDEALDLLAQYGADGRPVAGGMSLIPLLKLRLMSPACLIDISRLPELAGINERDGRLSVGAMTRHAEVGDSRLLTETFPWLEDAISGIGDVQVRNAGTVGGSLAHADPQGDWPAMSLALDATILCRSRRGSRSITADAFFQGPYATSLEPDELMTEVTIACPGTRSGGAHLKLERRAGDFGIAVASVQVELTTDDRIAKAKIGVGAVAHTAIRPKDAEDILVGERPQAALFSAAAEKVRHAVGDTELLSDMKASGEYRLAVIRVLLERALELAVSRAQKGSHKQ